MSVISRSKRWLHRLVPVARLDSCAVTGRGYRPAYTPFQDVLYVQPRPDLGTSCSLPEGERRGSPITRNPALREGIDVSQPIRR